MGIDGTRVGDDTGGVGDTIHTGVGLEVLVDGWRDPPNDGIYTVVG